MKHVVLFGLVLTLVKINRCLPYNSSVVSKYAKVAVFGNNKTEDAAIRGTVRNYKSANIWNHRLDPKSISPTTKKKNPSVAYQYPVYPGSESKLNRRTEHVPGIGEVIVAQAQDRFEARPLFAYRNKVASATYGPPPPPAAPSPSSAAVPAATAAPPAPPPPLPFPPQPSPSFDAAPPSNLYDSPYTSYNPPNFKPDESDSAELYPPRIPSKEDGVSSMDNPMSDSTESAKANIPDSYASLGPPLAQGDDGNDHAGDYQDPPPAEDPMDMYKYHDGPPQHPPKDLDDIYYPPDFPKNQIHGHGHAHDMKEPPNIMMPPEDHGMMMPPDDHSMMDDGKTNGGDAHMDVPPAPSHDYEHGHAFPQYLYDQHHYDHHVYEEIPHTTEPAKEDKRVSSTNYSYYYLGRKLWYIPLYFSIYFIIYVTVLILKSIARHKVRLKYKWYEHDTSAKKARSMDLDSVRYEEVTEIHRNVSAALRNATAKYGKIIPM